MAAKKKTKTSQHTSGKAEKPKSKADFVRAHPALSASAIVAKAKEQGIKMGVPYVYNVRGYDRKRRPGTRRGRPGRKAGAVTRPITTTSSAESLLKAVAAEVGLQRALDLLEGEHLRVLAFVRRASTSKAESEQHRA